MMVRVVVIIIIFISGTTSVRDDLFTMLIVFVVLYILLRSSRKQHGMSRVIAGSWLTTSSYALRVNRIPPGARMADVFDFCTKFGQVHSVYIVMDVQDLMKLRKQILDNDKAYISAKNDLEKTRNSSDLDEKIKEKKIKDLEEKVAKYLKRKSTLEEEFNKSVCSRRTVTPIAYCIMESDDDCTSCHTG